ncbi:hypothetical protein GUITHDRAFT_163496 [Guillardia theta CCMP2712]|uniref:Uncharacterized protein n=1 Tax=Guillardia theta (strain CCMP2712) TaxID=905079 RepID=L1J8D0_GUITC|nr:hypothetical protein GUITHDRAFT_163496 [Guillardia theta CCMP2712]EKX44607.1 hypothetical protein GUITHDRAFT_163496 [Guillardia theta CCMP2712]|eukprot:XP_005831587.1 hypothetical protein GUITHDRAFT_163496 [Guillardia theta CCMP2712]
MAIKASGVSAASLLLLTSLLLLLLIVVKSPASSVALRENEGAQLKASSQGWGGEDGDKEGYHKGWPEYDRVDDPPAGWVNVGTRSMHVSRSGNGELEKIDVPGDAVIRPVSDGYEVSLPDEQERDLYDEDRHIKKSRKWLKRSQFSDREWDENRLLRKFWNSEVHPDSRWHGWSHVGNWIDHVSDGDASMHVRLQRQEEGPGYPSNTDTTRNVWYYHDGSYSYDNPSKTPAHEAEDFDEETGDGAHDCDLKCMISHIAETIASAIISNNSSKSAVLDHPLPKWLSRGEKSRTSVSVITSKDGSVERIIVPYDSILSRGSRGWKISFPNRKNRQEGPGSTSEESVSLPVSQRWVHPAHSIVDVYSPYSDPYYCVDGSSNPECGTDKWVRERTHDYSLGWEGPSKEERARDWEAHKSFVAEHEGPEHSNTEPSKVGTQEDQEEQIAKTLVHLLAGLKHRKTQGLLGSSPSRTRALLLHTPRDEGQKHWAWKRDERMWKKLSKTWDLKQRNRRVEHRLAQLWQRSQAEKKAQGSGHGRFQQLALSADLSSFNSGKASEGTLEHRIDSRALQQLREQQERRKEARATSKQASTPGEEGGFKERRPTVKDQVRSWLSSYGDSGASLLLNRKERLEQDGTSPQL